MTLAVDLGRKATKETNKQNKIFWNRNYTIGVSNSLNSDKAKHCVGPDMGLSC